MEGVRTSVTGLVDYPVRYLYTSVGSEGRPIGWYFHIAYHLRQSDIQALVPGPPKIGLAGSQESYIWRMISSK